VILRPIRWAISALSTIVFLYVFFFIPIGRRTLYEHARRIAGTPEAHDFERDMGTAGRRVLEKAQHEIRHSFPLPGGDGGVSVPEAPAVPPARGGRRVNN
jgi:hypothetical protein